MIPDPPIIKKCSECSGLLLKYSIASGNTFGAVFWSDGKMEAPELPEYPSLVKCPHCLSPVWIDELETVGKVKSFQSLDTSVKNSLHLDVDDYASFLKDNRLDADAEKDLRIRAWWVGNDGRRSNQTDHAATNKRYQFWFKLFKKERIEKEQPSDFTETETNNLNALAALLDESDDSERLMKAEIMREQGEFDQALELLEHPFGKDLSEEVDVIKVRAQQRRSTIAVLNQEG